VQVTLRSSNPNDFTQEDLLGLRNDLTRQIHTHGDEHRLSVNTETPPALGAGTPGTISCKLLFRMPIGSRTALAHTRSRRWRPT